MISESCDAFRRKDTGVKTSRFAALLVLAISLTVVCSKVCLALTQFESKEYKFSFRYPNDWARLNEEQAGSILDGRVGNRPEKSVTTWVEEKVSVGDILHLNIRDIEKGQTFLFAWKNNAEDILADRYFTVVVENNSCEMDKEYRQKLEDEVVRSGKRVFDEYTVVESKVVKVGRHSDINSVFLHTRGMKFYDRDFDETHFFLEYFIYAIPLGDRTVRLTFVCGKPNATYMKKNVIRPVTGYFEEQKAEQANKKFESEEHDFSFEYPHDWIQLGSEEIIQLVDRFGTISLGFDDKDVSEGRVFLFAEKDIGNSIWAVSTLIVTVEDECPIVDETFRKMRAAQEARKVKPVFREDKSISEESRGGAGAFKVNYSIRESGIVKVNNVSAFFMHARGKIPKDRSETDDTTPEEYIPVDQFIYLIPLGDRAVKLTFTCDTGAAAIVKHSLVNNMVIRLFKGAKGKHQFNWGLWAIIGAGVLIAGLGALVFWLSKIKTRKMDKSINRRTFQPTKFQPKRPTSETKPSK